MTDRSFMTAFIGVIVGLTVLFFVIFALAQMIVGDQGESIAQNDPVIQRAVEERIAPVSKVKLPGEEMVVEASAAADAAAPAEAVEKTPEEHYMASCAGCHGAGIAGAPKVGDAAAWADRIAKGKDALVNSGLNGVPGTAMMARGGSQLDDDTIKAVVEYMIGQSK